VILHAAEAIVTARGGMTSHAAVVARGMGTPCVSGAGEIRIDYKAQEFSIMGRIVKAGEIVTVDGATFAAQNICFLKRTASPISVR